jgi:hypothetical protein
MNKICGYLVVRKPENNFDELGRGVYRTTPPCVYDKYYSGINRMPWFDLDEGYYSGALPMELIEIRSEIDNSYIDLSDIITFNDFEKTKKVLYYSNARVDGNDICVLYSDDLALEKGIIMTDNRVDWLGSDIFVSGFGSLLLLGIYNKPQAFPGFLIKLNKSGLFDIDIDIDIDKEYITRYREICASYNLEPVDFVTTEFMSTIAVGRLIV